MKHTLLAALALTLPLAGASAATFTVTATNDTGPGSLRQAILDANASPGADLIEFAMGSGGLTIAPASVLPGLTDPVSIDGTTQSGFAGAPVIELNGTGAGSGADGLRLLTSNCMIRGLVINRFKGDGIEISGPGGNVIEGCYIGVGVSGTNNLFGNSLHGIFVTNSPGNTLGGTTPAARNVIAGNTQSGIYLYRTNSRLNRILGNYIGIGADGATARPNAQRGVLIVEGQTNLIGGPTAGAGNVISRNGYSGIEINSAPARGNQVLGNLLGTDASGLLDLGNQQNGVYFLAASDNTIGGTNAGEANVIAFSHDNGVLVTGGVNTGTNNAIRGNAIYGSWELGIELQSLSGNGVSTNDPGDGDTGGNLLQNFPLLTAATNSATNVVITGSLSSRASTTYQLDFFSNLLPDPSGYGEGQTYLGSTSVTTDPAGNAGFTVTLPVTLTTRFLSATATDPFGNTSEFSACLAAGSGIPGQTFTVVNTNDSGPGSLRQAILDANAAITAGDTIAFDIPGTNLHVISPAAALPALLDPVVIDGYTQPGAQANSLADGFDASLRIRLHGSGAGSGADGLKIIAGNCTVRGLIITGFKGDGIELATNAHATVIQGNVIGLDETSADQGNTGAGINVNGTANNLVGGPVPAVRNVISGNGGDGIYLSGAANNAIQGNFLGTDFTGTVDRGNTGDGLQLDGAPSNLIGGTSATARNVIAGNDGNGVGLRLAGSTNNVVCGNFIGLDVTGTSGLGNGDYGVQIYTAHRNQIGGTNSGAPNRIAFSGYSGVYLQSGTNNAVRANSIYANEGLGLDLGTLGVTANDTNDADTGANFLQNYPILTNVIGAATDVWIKGTLNSRPSTAYQLDFYANPAPDPTGNGQGEVYLGAASVTTDPAGNASLDVSLPATLTGRYVAATATDPFGNTSEFSPCLAAEMQVPPITVVVTNRDDDGPGSLRWAITTCNNHPAATPNTIAFNIPGAGIQTIKPLSGLPTNREPVIIDGYTQPGSRTNSLAAGFDGVILIQIDGTDAGPVDGLAFTGDSNTVRGLNLVRFTQCRFGINCDLAAIRLTGSAGSVVEGNAIGFDLLGAPSAERNAGIIVWASVGTRIGGATPAARNVIGSVGSGLLLYSAVSNIVQGNFIGTDLTGTQVNRVGTGIQISGDSAYNLVGGTEAGARNLISGADTLAGNHADGIVIGSGRENLIQGNFIGTDVTGTRDLGNAGYGVWLEVCSSNVVGGTAPGAGNVISGNGHGVCVQGDSLHRYPGNRLEGNYIGTDLTGTRALPNGFGGVLLMSTEDTTVGGTAPGARNVVSGNLGSGIVITGGGYDGTNYVQANFIGTDATGTNALGNAKDGVRISMQTLWASVGGAAPGAGNLIAYNLGSGVGIEPTPANSVNGGTNNLIRCNRIFDNAGLGIDLGTNGAALNDLGDTDGLTGMNNLQNFPVLVGATNLSAGTLIAGTLNSSASTTYTLDFFANPACDPSSYGEGRQYLGSANVSTDGEGDASFNVTFPVAAAGYATATATGPFGDTSEFSACQAIVSGGGPVLTITSTNDAVAISWPTDPAGFRCVTTTNLAAPPPWYAVTNAVIIEGGCQIILFPVNPSEPARFFRLQHD